MPLLMAEIGKKYIIRKISGKEETIRFLANLGFVVGSEVSMVTEINGNIIVIIKGSRIAIGKDMAKKIIVSE